VPPPTPKIPLNRPAAVPIVISLSDLYGSAAGLLGCLSAAMLCSLVDAGGERQPVTGCGLPLVILKIVSPAAPLVEALESLRSDPSHAAVLLDIDGTLAPIVRHAADAHVPEATRTLLIEIARRYRLVGCVSGRRAAVARQIVAIGSIAYIGNHGAELLRPGATRPELDPELAAWSERVRIFATEVFTSEHQRLRVRAEDKQAIAAFHWRGAPAEDAAEDAVRAIAARAQEEGFAIHWGRKVLEVRPPLQLDKGLGVNALLSNLLPAVERGSSPDASADSATAGTDAFIPAVDREPTLGVIPTAGAHTPAGVSNGPAAADGHSPLHAALYVGDDSTDLDAFRMLRSLVRAGLLEDAVCVAVHSEEAPPGLLSEADLTIEGTDGVRQLLEALL
jgi:trehalose 6-phosphate phosphatase